MSDETTPTETTTTTTEPIDTIFLSDVSGSEPPAPPVIRLDDILMDKDLYAQQEAADRDKFAPLVHPNLGDIRAKLVSWATRGFQPPCDLVVMDVMAPNICSDGVQRSFFDYIQFVSGKTVNEHVTTLQAILPDFVVAYSYTRTQLRFGVVLKA